MSNIFTGSPIAVHEILVLFIAVYEILVLWSVV